MFTVIQESAEEATEYISRINRLSDTVGIHILASTTRWFFITLNKKLLKSFNTTAALKSYEMHPFFIKNKVKEKYNAVVKTEDENTAIISINLASSEDYKNRISELLNKKESQ